MKKNKYGISESLEIEVRRRDKNCVYCGRRMRASLPPNGSRKLIATWEHIDNDGHATRENMALCCGACNSSKGVKDLAVWLESGYCKRNGINVNTVAGIILEALAVTRK